MLKSVDYGSESKPSVYRKTYALFFFLHDLFRFSSVILGHVTCIARMMNDV
jgi:hypothetical protein